METIVTITLVVKGDQITAETALANVRKVIADWFVADAREKPPYRDGSLLHYSVHSTPPRIKDDSPDVG